MGACICRTQRRRRFPLGLRDSTMNNSVSVHLACGSCRTEIRLTVVRPSEESTDRRLRVAVNELLVDYGWLPTRSAPYCPHHAPTFR